MALKQVKTYYRQVEHQYFRMLEDSKEFDELLKQGKVDQSQIDQIHLMLSKLEENYKRLSYIMFLIGAPNRTKKLPKYNQQNAKLDFASIKADDKSVLAENEDVLKKFKSYLEGIKNESSK